MPEEILLVNPRKRRRKSTTRRRKSTARRANPRKRRAPARAAAPVRRRRRTVARAAPKRRANPRRRATARRVIRRRANPRKTGLMQGIVRNMLMPAATAATGALALDVAWAYLPLPAQLKAGPARYAAKGAGAIALSMLAGMVVKKSTAHQLGLGALTVVMHQAMTDGMRRFVPQVPLDGYYGYGVGFYNAGYNAGNAPELGAYVDGPAPSMPFRVTAQNATTAPGSDTCPQNEMGYYVSA